jgi:hypothetical protein
VIPFSCQESAAAQAEASATRQATDALADAALVQQAADTAAAAGHDRERAGSFHDLFVALASAADVGVHRAASAANQAVITGTNAAAAEELGDQVG